MMSSCSHQVERRTMAWSKDTVGPESVKEERAWRWSVKTLCDSLAGTSRYPHWQTAYGMPYQRHLTVKKLTEWKKPEEVDHAGSPRYWPDGNSNQGEYDIVNLEGWIEGYRIEPDGDIHLILSDGDSSIIAEVPDPKEVVAWAKPQCAAVRKWLQDKFGEPASWENGHWTEPRWQKGLQPDDTGEVVIVGYPFFDKKHNVSEAAANGIEIHPVLGISLVNDN